MVRLLLQDPGGHGFDMRFGGHRANIPKWKSGCIVCLYSCPGSKVGNARYTVRDYVQDRTKFRVKPGVLPADAGDGGAGAASDEKFTKLLRSLSGRREACRTAGKLVGPLRCLSGH